MKILTLLLLSSAAGFAQPEIPFDGTINLLKMPDHIYMGEAAGVATNSKGNIVVYTRTGSVNATIGGSRSFSHGGSRLFEFDASGKFLREIGTGLYGFEFAQAVKVDSHDNIWVVDRGSTMIIEFDPEGRVVMTMGRKPEAISAPGRAANSVKGPVIPASGRGTPGDNFNMPADVAFDSTGNIYVADGFSNARIAKFDKTGKYIKSWGSRGSESGQFNMPMSLAVDAQNNVYVADRGNKRIQVFDSNGAVKKQIANAGAPWAICISSGPHQYLFSSNSNDPTNLDNGEIYKMELDGTILGKFGRAGKLAKEFGSVNQLDCRNFNELLAGELTNWRVQKLSLHSK